MKSLSVIVFAFLCMASATDFSTSTFKVTLNGTLPNWLIYNTFDETNIRVKVETLQETTSRKFDWQSSQAVMTPGIVVMTLNGNPVDIESITYNCIQCPVTDGKETFGFNGSVDVFLFDVGGKYTFQGKTFNVQAGSFKFNFEITGWKFANDKNELTQQISVSEDKPKLQYSRFLKEQSYGTFVIDYPANLTVDGQEKGFKLTTSNKYGVQKFQFPQFKDSIYYDPTVYTKNIDPVPEDYKELETHTMRVFYNPKSPELYLLDQDKQAQGYLYVSVADMIESSNVQSADWRTQSYYVATGEETIQCKGKDTQGVQTLMYTCDVCLTNIKNYYFGQVKFYLINESMSQCKFGEVGYQVDVKQGDVKMDLVLSNYTWKNTKNILNLTILAQEGGVTKLSALGAKRVEADLKEFSASFAQEVVTFKNTNHSDNKAQETKVDSSNSQNFVSLLYFDADHSLYYDPVFHKGGNASLLSFILFALFFLL